MLIFLKIMTSALVILLITEIAKNNSIMAGLIAAMPINILISLCWIYFERKDINLLSNFSCSAFWGLFSTLFFMLILIFLFKKSKTFLPSVVISVLLFSISIVTIHKLTNMFGNEKFFSKVPITEFIQKSFK